MQRNRLRCEPQRMRSLSVLDLAPITQGSDAATALRNTLDLARHVERLGYRRYWLAEHHNMPGIASAATAVVIAHVAAGTSDDSRRLRRSHASERRAPGDRGAIRHARIVLSRAYRFGLGRAPGTDQLTARALRGRRERPRTVSAGCSGVEWVISRRRSAEVSAPFRAGPAVPIYLLGSVCPARKSPRRSACLLRLRRTSQRRRCCPRSGFTVQVFVRRAAPKPYVMLGVNVIAADTDTEGAIPRNVWT